MDAVLRLALIPFSVYLLYGGLLVCIVCGECRMHMGLNISITFDTLVHVSPSTGSLMLTSDTQMPS